MFYFMNPSKRNKAGAKKIGLFGSVARGKA